MPTPLLANLMCGSPARNHDFDFARRRLLDALYAAGRWFALHASNSVRDNPHLPGILGSRFITHPPYLRYAVSITRADEPLLDGIGPFEVDDEMYVIEHAADIDVLLHSRWGGEAMGRHFDAADRPLMYRRRVGDGGVLYLALGHCNRPSDKPPRRWPGPARPTRPVGPSRLCGAHPARHRVGGRVAFLERVFYNWRVGFACLRYTRSSRRSNCRLSAGSSKP